MLPEGEADEEEEKGELLPGLLPKGPPLGLPPVAPIAEESEKPVPVVEVVVPVEPVVPVAPELAGWPKSPIVGTFASPR